MIEIREIRGQDEVFLDGQQLKNTELVWNNSVIELADRDALRKIEKIPFADLSDIDVVDIRQLFELPALYSVCIMSPFDFLGHVQRHFTVEYFFVTSLLEWKNTYSFVDYVKGLKRISRSRNPKLKCIVEGSVYGGDYSLIVKFPVQKSALLIGPEIEKTFELMSSISAEAVNVALSLSTGGSLSAVFDFPETARTPCEQYLIYFVEFLRQLGLKATAALQHQDDHVLFTVTPARDGQKALDKIRTVLEIYIRLASSPLDEESVSEDDQLTRQLLANIYHLRGQLVGTPSVIELQKVTIDRKLPYNDVLHRSCKRTTLGPARERENYFAGLVALTSNDGKISRINLTRMCEFLASWFNSKPNFKNPAVFR